MDAQALFDTFQSNACELIQHTEKKGLAEFFRIQSKIHKRADQIISDTIARSGKTIDCKQGCFYCCHLKVDIHPLEALQISSYISNYLSTSDINTIKSTASRNWELIKLMSTEEQMVANLPCPLLLNGCCSVYQVRPITCRRFHSTTVNACKKGYDAPDISDPLTTISESFNMSALYSVGTNSAFKLCGYDSHVYDINAAILECLNNSHCGKRWTNKQTVFPHNLRSKDDPESLDIDLP